MKPRTIVTITLLLFVGASVAYLVAKEMGARPAQSPVPPNATAPQTGQAPATPPPASATNTPAAAKVVAYYFHGNVRCMTCRAIESYASEAVESRFAEALKDGRLEWRVVNVEDPGQGHFVQDFQLSTRSVVLERLVNGKRQEWKNLQRVWELVRGDKAGFLKYIQDETGAYLEAAGQ